MFSDHGPGLEDYPPTAVRAGGAHRRPSGVGPADRGAVDQQLRDGFLEEVRALAERPSDVSRTAAQALGYGELAAHLRGECSLDDAVERIVIRTRQFAVRQIRWFRRDPRITWFDADDDQTACLARPDGRHDRVARLPPLDPIDQLWRSRAGSSDPA